MQVSFEAAQSYGGQALFDGLDLAIPSGSFLSLIHI